MGKNEEEKGFNRAAAMELTPDELTAVYTWVDEIPLSRPKKNIARDFSDGVLAAEVVSYYCPRLVDIHNYSAANSLAQKMYNWNTLNERVFKSLSIQLSKEDISAVAGAHPLMIEAFLKLLKSKLEKCTSMAARKCESDKADEECRTRASRRHFSEKSSSSADRTPPSLASRKSTAHHSDSETQTLLSAENDSINGVSSTPAPNTSQIRELQETIEVLEAKVSRLEQLMKLKSDKSGRLQHAARHRS